MSINTQKDGLCLSCGVTYVPLCEQHSELGGRGALSRHQALEPLRESHAHPHCVVGGFQGGRGALRCTPLEPEP